MLERNLAGAYAKLVEGTLSEGCTLAVSQDFFSLMSSTVMRYLRRQRKVRAILTPDEGKLMAYSRPNTGTL